MTPISAAAQTLISERYIAAPVQPGQWWQTTPEDGFARWLGNQGQYDAFFVLVDSDRPPVALLGVFEPVPVQLSLFGEVGNGE